MILDSGHARRQIAFGNAGKRRRALDVRAREEIVAGNLQRIRQKAQRFQTRLTQTALLKPHGVEALADDIRQSLLTHVFGCTGSLHPFTKLNHNGTSIGIFVHYLDDVL